MFVAKWYTRASRVRIVIAKFDGRWTIPGGPYPIPELVALVGGLLCTLMLLPRFGHPFLTLIVGVAGTVCGVGAMRLMPYSPVSFGTRVHRVMRLYTSPISATGALAGAAANTVSTVRPAITVLEVIPVAAPAGRHARHAAAPVAARGAWDGLFEQPATAAAELFG
ncbi:hypothetical protein [Mycobacterium sp.]|uniref:hypothetical protein n=1 Tax=Mycobacterium sp. TaxID=1785 RepID=UPI0025EE5F43|nr:hypothetical protein [Mycobacterium sp.]